MVRNKVLFFSFWGIISALISWGLIILREFSWVLLLYIPLFFAAVASSYFAMSRKTKRSWIIALSIGLGSMFIALVLLLFIGDIFDYDGGGMFPGFAYFMERIYSWLAAIVFGLNLFSLAIVFLVQKKQPFLAAIAAVIEVFALLFFLVMST